MKNTENDVHNANLIKVLPTKISPDACGDIPKLRNCNKCKCKIIDMCWFQRQEYKFYLCLKCFTIIKRYLK